MVHSYDELHASVRFVVAMEHLVHSYDELHASVRFVVAMEDATVPGDPQRPYCTNGVR